MQLFTYQQMISNSDHMLHIAVLYWHVEDNYFLRCR